jgi:hypothetical protein
MSTQRTFLRHPLVIAATALGLMVVAMLNVQTFLGVGSLLGLGPGPGEDHLAPPSDLAETVQEAMQAGRAGRRVSAAQQGSGSGLVRDPFTGSAPAAAVRPPAPRRTEQRQRVKPLVCTAVFLGGPRPLALIDDETFGPGDKVRGLEVVGIDAEGVRLQRTDGSDIHLEVSSGESAPAQYHLVTGVRGRNEQTETPPAGSSANEGTE